jgi:pyruvate/2-oxoglutarate dehydrogenase complex dihydrolipoamide acyltransferase (E2) component
VTVGPAAPGRHRLSPRARRRAAEAERDRVAVPSHQAGNGQDGGRQGTCVVEVDVTKVVELARQADIVVRDGLGSQQTLTSFLASAAVSVLRRRPHLNDSVAAAGPDGAGFRLVDDGSRGVLWDTPILAAGQVAALGAGAVVERVVVVRRPDDERVIAIRSMTYLALSYDPRVVESVDAAGFLADLKECLESGRLDLALS